MRIDARLTGRGIRTVAATAALLLCVAAPAGARDTTIAIPDGFRLASADGVASREDRHALALADSPSVKTGKIQQVIGATTVFTDLEGVADRLEYSDDGRHLLVRQTLPPGDDRHPARLFSLIDGTGEIVWSAASVADYRFTAGGDRLYVAHFPGPTPQIRVFDVRGKLIRAIEPRRPHLDARVLGDGDEALILFASPASRSTDARGREVRIERVRFGDPDSVVWSVALDQDTLKYPELIAVGDSWVLIPTRSGFVAVHESGETTRHATVGALGASVAPGSAPDTAVVSDEGRMRSFDLRTGVAEELDTDPELRFGGVGYRDGMAVLSRPGEVVLKALDEPTRPARDAERRKRSVRSPPAR